MKLIKVECGKCGGKGHIRAFSHVAGGACFECDGNGYKMLKHKPQPARSFRVSFLWTDKSHPNYRGGEFCHCWNKKARSQAAIERQAKAALASNGAADYLVWEVM